jgi:hypothetical protein
MSMLRFRKDPKQCALHSRLAWVLMGMGFEVKRSKNLWCSENTARSASFAAGAPSVDGHGTDIGVFSLGWRKNK